MPADLKELRFFSFDPENPYQRTAKSTRVRSIEEYRQWFADAGDAVAVGEASPNYLRGPVAAQNIKDTLGNPRLIVSLRNPADRLYSLYLMGRRARSRNRSFEETAFSEDCAWIKGNFVWSDLQRFFRLFSSANIKVVLFDDLVRDAQSVTRDLYEYLNVDSDFVPDFAIKNLGGLPKSPGAYSIMMKAKNLLKRSGVKSDALRKAWSKYRDDALYKPTLDSGTRAKVLEVFRDDILRTQELIDIDLRLWLK